MKTKSHDKQKSRKSRDKQKSRQTKVAKKSREKKKSRVQLSMTFENEGAIVNGPYRAL